MGNQFPTGFNPHMMGDFPGTFARQTVTVFGVQTITTVFTDNEPKQDKLPAIVKVTTTQKPTSKTITVLVPVSSLGAFKIAENESPMPADRVFFTYNSFSNLRGPQNGPLGPPSTEQSTSTDTRLTNTTTTTNTTFPTINGASSLQREVFGFEKTFLNGYASIEVRLPLLQQQSNLEGFSSQNIGDLTILGKYAFILNRDTGNVLAAGLGITAPTGPGTPTIDGSLHSTLIQPWVGYVWNSNLFFVQAFHSIVVPTDPRDVTLLFNDVGFNFWLYRGEPNRLLNFIVPVLEAHVTTPLNKRDINGPIYVPDVVIMTGGVHLGLFGNSTLSVGAATPVTGPRVFNLEAFVQLNWRF
jgi:hypothetical protein